MVLNPLANRLFARGRLDSQDVPNRELRDVCDAGDVGQREVDHRGMFFPELFQLLGHCPSGKVDATAGLVARS